ncbi:MAG: zinc ribbon domain-containing protein [Deltaproteobacteria bacterium]|nr:zinc ribbon domain-containing protein [Deltaproteobacteria bacterium]
MPLYEYECKKCEDVFEVTQKFSDEPLKKCPECGGAVKKIMSMSSFHLKGSGWFKSSSSSKDKGAECKDKSSDKPDCSGCPSAE